MTGSWLAGLWHVSVSSPALSLPWEFWIGKLDGSLSGFCCRYRTNGWVEDESENLPILHSNAHAQCPRTPPAQLQFGSLGTCGFFKNIGFLLLCFSSSGHLSVPGSYLLASGPLHLLFSWQVLRETFLSAQKSLPLTTASKIVSLPLLHTVCVSPRGARTKSPVGRDLCQVLLIDICPHHAWSVTDAHTSCLNAHWME